ncbi:MAG: methyltransferase domain-containing protein [Myxococcales bacterium]|nr:methyltransferase domain-containing protein [Myxococcales bacterium]
MAVEKRSLKQEKLARIYDDQIAPVWGSRFGKMLLRDLALPERGQILDISCGTGYPLIEVLRRKGDAARIIAIDASSAMLDIARKKVADLGALGKKGVFFRTESPVPRLSFADGVYDLVLCNLGLNEMPNAAAALADFARVTKIGGEVRCTMPLEGTWAEFHDIYREVLVKHDRHEALDRLDAHLASYPTVDEACGWMRAAGLEPRVEVEEFTLLFKSSREFFFAPVVEFGPLPAWKAVAGSGQELQDVFWFIKESIDAYFGERAFQVTVKAGCLVGKKLDPALLSATTPDLDAPIELNQPRARLADGSVRPAEAGTAEVDILEIQEVEGSHNEIDYEQLSLDAFTDGKSRPRYLQRKPPADTQPPIDAASLIDGEEDASDAPTGGHPRWETSELAGTDDVPLAGDDDDADTGDHLAPGGRRRDDDLD